MTVLRSRPPLAAAFLLAGLSCLPARAIANEPGWSDERRAELSDAVFDGRVTGVERAEALNDREDLYRATVEIGSVAKRPELIGDGTVRLYFERPNDGGTGGRCPGYVGLAAGDRATFYVRMRKVGPEVRAFLEMGSDVRRIDGTADDGRRDAASDLAANRPRYFYVGPPRGEGDPLLRVLRRDYGLTVDQEGCIIVPPRQAYVEAYNAEIFKALEAKFGPDPLAQAREKANAEGHAGPKDGPPAGDAGR